MKRLLSILFFSFLILEGVSQSDSVAFSNSFILYEGLYLNYADLKHNWPIPKEKINTQIDKKQLDFYTKLIESETVEYVERDGKPTLINSGKVWGFCQNNVIYVNINRTFFRVPVFGAISYFVAAVPVSTSPGYNVFINSSGGTNATEIREFMLDFYTGELKEFNSDLLESYLKKDEEIFKAYSALNKKQKKEQASRYIRKYNEKHPIYFPRN